MDTCIKQVIIVRTDLNMSVGKTCSQVAHASMKAILDQFDKKEYSYKFRDESDHLVPLMIASDERLTADEVVEKQQRFIEENADLETFKYEKIFKVEDPLFKWLQSSFTKVVLSCDSLDELLVLEKKANENGLINALITDNGLTEFKDDCDKCNGTGIDYVLIKCPICGGTGKINKPTITCLAIGPDYSEKIDKIIGHLKLR